MAKTKNPSDKSASTSSGRKPKENKANPFVALPRTRSSKLIKEEEYNNGAKPGKLKPKKRKHISSPAESNPNQEP